MYFCRSSLTQWTRLFWRVGCPTHRNTQFVTPLLKKPDTTDMNNYRPVSNRGLSFMSKSIERVVANQLSEYLSANDLLSRFQSTYRKGHSTETALPRVWSDMLMTADERRPRDPAPASTRCGWHWGHCARLNPVSTFENRTFHSTVLKLCWRRFCFSWRRSRHSATNR